MSTTAARHTGSGLRTVTGTRRSEAARPARITPKRATAVRCMAVHHRQMAPMRKSSTYTR